MKKNSFLCTALFLVAMLIGATPSWGQTYKKISTLDELESGKSYVITGSGNGASLAMNTTNGGNYFSCTTVAIENDAIVTSDASIVWTITQEADGYYSIKNGDSYVACNKSANNAQIETAYATTTSWVVSVTDGTFSFNSVNLTDRYLQNNSNNNQERFACYKGTQNNLTLYKLEETGLVTPTITFNEVEGDKTVFFHEGATYNSAATATPAVAITYSSSNEEVATIDGEGVVALVGAGTTTISATSEATTEYNAGAKSYDLTVLSLSAQLPYSNDFKAGLDSWLNYTVVGTTTWGSTSYGAQINAYQKGATEAYLVSPAFDAASVVLSFGTQLAYSEMPLQLYYSVDFNPETMAAPSEATWTEITDQAAWATDATTVESGEITLNGLTAPVRFAFKYTSTDTDAGRWTITSINVIEGESTPEAPEYCTNFTQTYNATYNRVLNSIELNGTNVSVGQTRSGNLYFDRVSTEVPVEAGVTYTPVVNWSGEWMHGYFFIDYDNDGDFNNDLNADGTPAEGGELVSYTFYSSANSNTGKNSAGEDVSDNQHANITYSAFTIPADLAPGTYRMRFKVDWNNIDPCVGSNDFSKGGSVTDFTLKVEAAQAPTYTVNVEDANNRLESLGYYDGNEYKILNPGGKVPANTTVYVNLFNYENVIVTWNNEVVSYQDFEMSFVVNEDGTLKIEEVSEYLNVTFNIPEGVTYECRNYANPSEALDINAISRDVTDVIFNVTVPESQEVTVVKTNNGVDTVIDALHTIPGNGSTMYAYSFAIADGDVFTVTVEEKTPATPAIDPAIPAEDGLVYGQLNMVFDGTTGPVQIPADVAATILASDDATVVVDYTTSVIEHSMTFVGASNTEGSNFFINLINYNTIPGFGLRWGDGGECLTYGTEATPLTGRHQLVYTMDGGNLSNLYYDGLFGRTLDEGTNSWVMNFKEAGANAMYVGGVVVADNDNKYPFEGTIHSVRIYTKVLSGTEIAALNYDFSATPGTCTITINNPDNVNFELNDNDYNTLNPEAIARGTEVYVEISHAVPADKTLNVTWNDVPAELDYSDGDYYSYKFVVETDGVLSITLDDNGQGPVEYCIYEGTNQHSGRSFNSLTVTGGTDDFTISQYVGKGGAIYQDFTDRVLNAAAGATLNFSTSWSGEWMHGYLYIDYNNDGEFDATINDDGTPAEGSEIVSYTFYSPTDGQFGKNSAGETVENNSKLDYFPGFTLPAGLATGDYRVRFKIDWNELDACGIHADGKNALTENGGIIADFTLHVEQEGGEVSYYTVSVEDVPNGTIVAMVWIDDETREDGGYYSYLDETMSGQYANGSIGYVYINSIAANYHLKEITANGVVLDDTEYEDFYEFTVNGADVVISAVFEEGGAIDELESNGVKVYATDSKIVINSEKEVNVQIYTVNGVAFKAPFSAVGNNAIDAPAGMYIVNVDGVAKVVMVK